MKWFDLQGYLTFCSPQFINLRLRDFEIVYITRRDEKISGPKIEKMRRESIGQLRGK